MARLNKEQKESIITDIVYSQWQEGKRNQVQDDADFDGVIDILECQRTEKDYDWMSDVFIPEFPSIHLTEASLWSNQYFQNREFVDVFLEGTGEEEKSKAKAAKSLINTTLNIREVYHYPKYMRARTINSLRGCVYAIPYWEQNIRKEVKTRQKPAVDIDDFGNPTQKIVPENYVDEIVLKDHFNYDIPDPRCVFTDNSYVYSVQDKQWIIVQHEKTYEELKEREESHSYINLDLLKKVDNQETEISRLNERKDNQYLQSKPFDVIDRFGKIWGIVTDRDDYGCPTKMTVGYDERGKPKDNSELVESIVSIAIVNGKKILIRFQPTPFRTSLGKPYRAIIRGLCYIHPTKDIGMSDGKYGKEMQVALNDTINMSNDRVKLATLPTLKGRRLSVEDNDTIYFEPEHTMVLENMDDLAEFRIQDNIQGALGQAQLFISKLQQVEAIYPTTMGELPGKASTTATAVAGAESRTNLRGNYKSLTFEYTFLTELYWMILQMTHQFMHPKTAVKIMGKDSENFDPDAEYSYKPVTSNIETEYNKDKRIQRNDQMIGRLTGLASAGVKEAFTVIAMLLHDTLSLQGKEYQEYADVLKSLANAKPPDKDKQGDVKDMPDTPTSNQSGQPMSLQEQSVRQM